MKRVIALALLLAASCSKQADGTGPDSFALSLPVEPAPGAQVQRVDLPAAALIALQRADKGDIRIFDARGKPLSIALTGEESPAPSEVRFEAIPVADDGDPVAPAGVSVRIDGADQAVTVDATGTGSTSRRRSVLLDTRKVSEPAIAIVPEAQLPVGRPVSLTIEAGGDIKTWDYLADHVLFRPSEGQALLGSGRIALAGVPLKDRYLRLSWDGAERTAITGAALFTAKTAPPPRVAITATGLTLTDTHTAQFAMPPGPGPASMRLTMTGQDGVVPVSLLGRNAVEHAWTPLAMAVLRQGQNGALFEQAGGMREYRIEADKRSAGFSSAPGLELRFESLTLLAAFNGAGPYKLAVGNAKAGPAFLAASDLATETGPFTSARVEGKGTVASITLPASPGETPYAPRNLLLWGALLLGAVVLAFAAYRLLRANSGAV